MGAKAIKLSRITHHSHSFTRLEIYHHIYLIDSCWHVSKDMKGDYKRATLGTSYEDSVTHA